jgi:hypothetical protein
MPHWAMQAMKARHKAESSILRHREAAEVEVECEWTGRSIGCVSAGLSRFSTPSSALLDLQKWTIIPVPGCSRGAVVIVQSNSLSSPPPFSRAVNGGTTAVSQSCGTEKPLPSPTSLALTLNIRASNPLRSVIMHIMLFCVNFFPIYLSSMRSMGVSLICNVVRRLCS